MESIKQINQEFKPVNESRILKSGSNENELNELWDIESAGETAPGEEKNIILTPAVIEAYFNGEDVPELQKAIESLTEWYNGDYFHYNNYLLVDSDIKVYLTNYYRADDFKDNLLIETNPEFNILYNELPADAEYYFKTGPDYNPYRFNVEAEALDFLTWTIWSDNLKGSDWKTTLTDKDITAAIAAQDHDHQEIIRTANYKELYQDIKTTYKKLLQEYLQEAEEALNLNFYEDVYLENQAAAEQEIINQYINTPIKNIN